MRMTSICKHKQVWLRLFDLLPTPDPIMTQLKTLAALLAGATLLNAPTFAADTELNLYTARHYQTDEALYSNFTAKTDRKSVV